MSCKCVLLTVGRGSLLSLKLQPFDHFLALQGSAFSYFFTLLQYMSIYLILYACRVYTRNSN
jgi:hypothetical protein